MSPQLTIVFACLNDAINAAATIASIRLTAGERVKIVVVDDASATPLSAMIPFENRKNARFISNAYRCGVGPSRTIGVETADTDWVLICDSHMTFTNGWYEACERYLSESTASTVWCATCLALDSKRTNPDNPASVYQGGTLNILGPDKVNGSRTQVLEGIWHPPPVQDQEEIPCAMGAGYFVNREWFIHIDPLRHLRQWGEDELMLSVKSWLAGGSVRYMEKVRIGHKFLTKGERQPFNVMPGYPMWNKLFAIHTLCPPDVAPRFAHEYMRSVKPAEWAIAEAMLRHDWHLVAVEKARNKELFVQDIRWLAKKFNIPFPWPN
jgi:glycosyltransferase involved in cell wall biosynthesis